LVPRKSGGHNEEADVYVAHGTRYCGIVAASPAAADDRRRRLSLYQKAIQSLPKDLDWEKITVGEDVVKNCPG